MRRRLHLIFAVATVLLVAVWLLSGRWLAHTSIGAPRYAFVSVFRGSVNVGFVEGSALGRSRWVTGGVEDTMRWPGSGYRLEWLPEGGWRKQELWTIPPSRSMWLAIPLWIPAGLTGTLTPLLWRRHRRRLRRERAGKCFFCGYDLAGIQPDEAGTLRCPECGKQAMDNGSWTMDNAIAS